MNETVFDKEMKDMLHRCADELHAPDKLKTRVDFALKNGSSRPRRRWGRWLDRACGGRRHHRDRRVRRRRGSRQHHEPFVV